LTVDGASGFSEGQYRSRGRLEEGLGRRGHSGVPTPGRVASVTREAFERARVGLCTAACMLSRGSSAGATGAQASGRSFGSGNAPLTVGAVLALEGEPQNRDDAVPAIMRRRKRRLA
jgi:hypothetical protein